MQIGNKVLVSTGKRELLLGSLLFKGRHFNVCHVVVSFKKKQYIKVRKEIYFRVTIIKKSSIMDSNNIFVFCSVMNSNHKL